MWPSVLRGLGSGPLSIRPSVSCQLIGGTPGPRNKATLHEPCGALDHVKAIQITKLDGPTSVELVDVEPPKPAPDQVLISVRAAGVGFPDVLQSRGLYHVKPALPYTPG